MEEPAPTALNLGLPLPARNIPASSVESLQQSFRDRGFLEEALERVAQPQKQISLSIYHGKWNIFCAWCGEQGSDPISASARILPSPQDQLGQRWHQGFLSLSR